MNNNLRIRVAGTGLTKFGELWGENVESLAAQASREALKEAGLEIEDMDLLIVGNMLLGQLEGRGHGGRIVADALDFFGPSLAVEAACASGGLAVRTGLMAIKAGMARKVLVVGAEKMTDADSETITRALMGAGGGDEQMAGATFASLYALMHQSYQRKYHVENRLMAAMAVLSHKHGALNPLAQFQKTVTADEVMESVLVADPVRLLHCAPISDGAAALVLATGRKPKVEIIGSGQGGDSLSLAPRKDLWQMRATQRAMKEALDHAKIKASEIDVAEIHDCFSVAGLMALEDLGFCERGLAGKYVVQVKDYMINPSGGLKAAGHPVGATGVKQVVEIVRQLQGRGGNRQVLGAKIGLTQNVGGAGATALVHILKVND